MQRTDDIRPVERDALDGFLSYLEDQMRDNGQGGTPVFMPYSREMPWNGAEKIASFRGGLDTPIGEPGWRRPWCALGPDGAIMGHVDLRAHDEPSTGHRALLGMGVHRDHRRRGLGRALVEFAIAWALRETTLDWIDLHYLGGNLPAERLYLSLGFEAVGIRRDMFRVDGRSVDDIIMTKRIRGSS